MSIVQLAAVVLAVTAFASWLNAKLFKLPVAAALLLLGLASCAVVWAADRLAPGLHMGRDFSGFVERIAYPRLVLDFMLAYLLFAGAMNVDVAALRRRWAAVGVLASLGVVVTALIVAAGFWGLALLLGYQLPFAWALVFGVLISPTDPIAVLAMTKRTALQPELRAQIEGEALFNDGVAVVLFRAALAFALAQGAGVFGQAEALRIGVHVLVEAFGGAMLGLVLALAALSIIRAVNDWPTETLITVALATGVYAGANALHLSGPIGVVVAGLVVGSRWGDEAMDAETRRHLHPFWHMVDEAMNAVLFLLLGFQAYAMRFEAPFAALAAGAVALVLVARWAAIALPSAALRVGGRRVRSSLVAMLTWAGVRGGLSMAMALSLPDGEARDLILAGTMGVILFSILAQSMSTEALAIRWGYGERLRSGGPAPR